jgi:hypothetical protein
MFKKKLNFIVSSNPANGSINLSADGSRFQVRYEEPISIPDDAKNIEIEVPEANIWWTVPNVISNQNDAFRLTDTGAGSGTPFGPTTINIPQGLYDLSGLANAIERELVSAGAAVGTISFSSDTATSKVQITANFVGITIDFTIANSVGRDILGFNNQTLGPSVVAPTIWLADNVATFNTVNSFLIHGDIVDNGMSLNGTFSQIMAQVQIDVSPGSLITYTPFRPATVSGSHLKNTKRNSFTYWLTDEQNRAVNTGGEYWDARIKITYEIPINKTG